ncbi:MAG: hypothetical protein O7G84_00980 [Gammaproteobacteria bacterium]|nr:hypothetical protein [Gammaproteobacteria bacterium]
MKVKILVEFNVPGTDDESVARGAASMAAHEWLTVCEIGGGSMRIDKCTVHVDGHGEFEVMVGDDHD